MNKNGIECGVHFKPLHQFKPFKNITVTGRGKIDEAFSKTVSLPLYDTLTYKEIEKIINLVYDYKHRFELPHNTADVKSS